MLLVSFFSQITPALTERRERCEFVSGADGKMAKPPSAERADPDARCRFGSTHCYPATSSQECGVQNRNASKFRQGDVFVTLASFHKFAIILCVQCNDDLVEFESKFS